jgi:hypothetical protein
MRTVITTNSVTATNDPAGSEMLMLDGQSTEGRTNQARKESSPCHGEPTSAVGDGVSARSNAVSHTIPTVR